MAIVTYNIQLKMDEKSTRYWVDTLTQSQNCYNTASKLIRQLNLPLSLKAVHNALYYQLREEYPMIPSQSVIKTVQDVIAAYKTIRKNKQKNTDIPTKKSLSLHLDKRLYSNLNLDGISITGEVKNKRTRYRFHMYDKIEELLSNYTTCDPLMFIRGGKVYLSIPFNVCERPVLTEQSVGVDLGERFLFVTSEGKAFRDKTYLRERRKAEYLKRCLQSKGTKSAKRKLRRLSKKIRHISNDMCHRACNELLRSTDAGIIVLEDLKKLKQNTSKNKNGRKNTGHNRRLGQVPFYKFKEMLTYKAPLCGKRVETVSAYNTSQTDCRTGKTDGIRIKRRYVGADGIVLDADYNAAVNIAKKGKHPFSMNVPLDGTLTILKGRPSSIGQSSHVRCVGTNPIL